MKPQKKEKGTKKGLSPFPFLGQEHAGKGGSQIPAPRPTIPHKERERLSKRERKGGAGRMAPRYAQPTTTGPDEEKEKEIEEE